MWSMWLHEGGQEAREAVRTWLRTRELHKTCFSVNHQCRLRLTHVN